MATYYKKSVNAALGSNTAWSATGSGGADNAGPPILGDTAIWQVGSLGASLTGSFTATGINIDGALTNIAHSSGTITVGAGGITLAPTNNRQWTETGTITIGAVNQTWKLYSTAGSPFLLNSATALSGSGILTLQNAANDTNANLANLNFGTAANTGFTGKIVLERYTGLTTNLLSGGIANADVEVVGGGALIWGGTGAITFTLKSLTVNVDPSLPTVPSLTLGVNAGRTINFGTTPVTLNGGPTLNVTDSITFGGAITGTAGFTKAGAGALTISPTIPANNTITGTIKVTGAGGFSAGIVVGSQAAPRTNINVFPGTGGIAPEIVVDQDNDSFFFWPDGQTTTIPNNFSGDGTVGWTFADATPPNTLNLTLTGDVSGLTGIQSNTATTIRAGLSIGTFGGLTSVTTLSTMPATLVINGSPSNGTFTNTVTYSGSGTPTARKLVVYNAAGSAVADACTYKFNSSGSQPVVFDLGISRVPIGGALGGTINVTLGGTNTLNNTVSGPIATYGAVTGTIGITKADAGRWILSANNTYTGTTTISGGTLSAQGIAGTRTPLGGSGAVTVTAVTGSGTLDISSTDTTASSVMSVNKAGTALSLGGTGTYQLTSTTGFNEYVCAGVTLNTTLPVNISAGAYLRMGNTAAMAQSGGTWGITKTGDGEYNLGTTSNTFAGTVTVTGGTLSFEASVPSGAISPLGNATSAIVLSGTTLKYRGAGGHTLGRAVSLSGSPSFDASGTGAVTFSPAITHAAGARTITFKGSSTNDNTFTTALTNNGLDAVSVTKTEDGKWVLSGAPSYTGDTTVSAGTLTFNGQTVQQNVVMNGTGVLDDTVLAGPQNITCNGGTPEIKANANNTVSGATSITSGSLRVTTEVLSGGKPVKVLGDTDVTVSATLQTTVGTNQRGQMRYGGDLTFSAGSTLRIG